MSFRVHIEYFTHCITSEPFHTAYFSVSVDKTQQEYSLIATNAFLLLKLSIPILIQIYEMSSITPDPVCKIMKEKKMSVYGLILACLNPPPPTLVSFYNNFRSHLEKELLALRVPSNYYYLYPVESLHLTIATFHKFTKPLTQDETLSASTWLKFMLDVIELPDWPSSATGVEPKIELNCAKIQENGVGTLLFSDTSGYVSRMRNSLRHYSGTITGRETLGQIDCLPDDIAIPTIIHSTVLRWCQKPSVELNDLQEGFRRAYQVAGGPVTIPLEFVRVFREWEPYMKVQTCERVISLSPAFEKIEDCEKGENIAEFTPALLFDDVEDTNVKRLDS